MYGLSRKSARRTGCMIALAIGISAMACGGGSSSAVLEARIAELEAKIHEQQSAIATVAFAATTPRGSIFDAPLKRFFDSPEFWENVVVDAGACLARCAQERTEGVLLCPLSPIDHKCIFVHASGPITTNDCAAECVNQSLPRIP